MVRRRRTATGASPAPRPRSLATASPTIAPLVVLAVVVASQALALGMLRRLPGAPLGGDLYYQMGCVRSIRASLDPMASCSTSGALPGYLPLYGTLIAALSRIVHLDVFDAMRAGAVLLAGLSVWLVGRVIGRLYGPATGSMLAGIWYLAHPAPILRYTDFAAGIVAPLVFLALALYLLERSRRAAFFLGVMLAAAGYTHAVLFVGAAVLAVAVVAIDALRRGDRPWRAHLAHAVGRAAIVGALALLALGYWWKPIFVYGGHASPHYTDWNGGPSLMTLADRVDYTMSVVRRALDPHSPVEPVVTLLAIAGAAMIVRRRAPREWRVAGLLAALTALGCLHYFVTMPLLGAHFVPEYAIALLWGCARFLLAGAAVSAAVERLRGPRSDQVIAWAPAALAALGAALAITNPALATGRTPLHPSWTSLQRFVERETRPGDVFLSNNELSFALASLTGRKVVTTRRAQNDAFLDMDARNLHVATILYGHDATLRRRLIDAYDVKYLFWTDEWASTEFYVDAAGRVIDSDDPLLWFENRERDQQAASAGVRFVHHLGFVDPMLRGETYPRFPLTIVTPDNYTRPDRPWNADFDRWLTRAWSYEEGGRTIAALYRVRRS